MGIKLTYYNSKNMNKEILNKLQELQVEMKEYAKYLEESTYHPYSKVESFASTLKNIINEIENESFY